MEPEGVLISLAMLVTALVYAAVGQAGATGYIAVMGLAGLDAPTMKVTALALNLLVAGIAAVFFLRSEQMALRRIWPFVLPALPFALLGGAIQLPGRAYLLLIGLVLLIAAMEMARSALRRAPPGCGTAAPPAASLAVATSAAIGFIAGLTGTGGGVFLAPVLLGLRWTTLRQTAVITAISNLLNSTAGLIGARAIWPALPGALPLWLVAVTLGGLLGARLGSRHLPDRALRALLALILLFSALYLIWQGWAERGEGG